MNPAAETKEDALCPTGNETVLFYTGGLATAVMTGGAATLAERGFWRFLAGSALGYAGGLAAAAGIFLAVENPDFEYWVENSVGIRVGMGVLILGHAAVTGLSGHSIIDPKCKENITLCHVGYTVRRFQGFARSCSSGRMAL